MRLLLGRRSAFVVAAIVLVGASFSLYSGARRLLTSSGEIVAPAAIPRDVRASAIERGQRTVSHQGELTPAAARLLFALAHRTSDASHADDLFAAKSWYVAPPPPPPPPPAPPAEPTAPPLPYAFVGSYAEGDNATVYFLTRGDRVYDVKPGDTLDKIYSVDGVENGALMITYKPLNIRQSLTIGDGP